MQRVVRVKLENIQESSLKLWNLFSSFFDEMVFRFIIYPQKCTTLKTFGEIHIFFVVFASNDDEEKEEIKKKVLRLINAVKIYYKQKIWSRIPRACYLFSSRVLNIYTYCIQWDFCGMPHSCVYIFHAYENHTWLIHKIVCVVPTHDAILIPFFQFWIFKQEKHFIVWNDRRLLNVSTMFDDLLHMNEIFFPELRSSQRSLFTKRKLWEKEKNRKIYRKKSKSSALS